MNTGVLCLRMTTILSLIIATADASHESTNSSSDFEAPVPGTYELPAIKNAADGALLDSTGKAVSLRALSANKITVLTFISTRCGDAKAFPYAAGVRNHLHRSSREDAALAKNLRLIGM